MSYRWEPKSGAYSRGELESAGLLPSFDSQRAAEEWLGLFYSDLLDGGVAEVSLHEETRLVYGPMSLDA